MADTISPGDGRPRLRAGEVALRAFISGVIDAETQPARDEATKALDEFWFTVWIFEYTPASTERIDWSYIQKVRECDLLIWVVGSTTSEPVEREIREALAHDKPIIVIRLKDASPDEATNQLVDKIGTKWSAASLDEIQELVALSVRDEIIRKYRERAPQHRLSNLEEFGALSQARSIERWLAAGLSRREALDFLADASKGAPPPTAVPTADEPLKIITGPVGAGKSLVGERLFQQAVAAKISDADAPIPVWIDARDLTAASLLERIEQSGGGRDSLRINGAFVVVEDASQVGSGRAEDLLRQARVLVHAFP
ncbi:MAG: hypothetical protein WAL84_11530, partial [Candidatus Dormiibacterota bacterium]